MSICKHHYRNASLLGAICAFFRQSQVKATLAKQGRSRSKQRIARSRRRLSSFEFLESKIAPTTVIWLGLGAIFDNWSVGLNWSTLSPPQDGDDVIFTGILQTTNVNDIANLSLHSITFSANNFSISGSAITLTGSGGGIVVDNGVTTAATINLPLIFSTAQGVSVANSGATLRLSRGVSGAGGLTKTGAGKLVLSSASNYTGATTVNAGILANGVANALPGSNDLIVNGGIFDLGGFAQTLRSISGAGTITNSGSAAILTVNNSSSTTFSGPITGAVKIVKINAGTLALTNSGSNYSGGTELDAGILSFSSGALGSGSITFGGGTLQYALANSQDISGRITGSSGSICIDPNGNAVTYSSPLAASNTGGLTMLGSGTLLLSGNSGYSGPTLVSAGVLLVDGTIGVSTDVEVSGGTLGGTGSIGGEVTVDSGGTFAPGDTSAGTGILHAGSLIFASGSRYLMDLNGTTLGAEYDQGSISGGITLGSPTLVATLGFSPTVGTVFTIVSGATSLSGIFSGLPEGTLFFIGGRLFAISYAGGSGHDVTLSVVQAVLNVLGITANGKTYDGTTDVTLNTGSASLSGIVAGDPGTVLLDFSALGAQFSTKNASSNMAVNISGIALTGTSAMNYTLNQPSASATIFQRPLTVTPVALDRVYDGTTAASVTLGDDRILGDDLTLSLVSATFDDRNAGSGKLMTVTGISVQGGADAGNYTLAATAATANATIGIRPLVVTGVTDTKTYDGTTHSAAIPVITSGSLAPGDVAAFFQTFNSRNAGIGLTLAPGGAVNDGNGGGNYGVTLVNATGTIVARILTVTATTEDKIYDATAQTSANLTDDRIVGDALTLSYSTANFSDKYAGIGKSVTIAGITILPGGDAGNYTLAATSVSASASIVARVITITASGVSKVYDGSASATVTLAGNGLPGDALNLNYSSAIFDDKHVGAGKEVTVSGLILSGADASNYSLAASSTSATANITARTLVVTATGVDRIYDGTTDATVTLSDNGIPGDAINLSYTTAIFNDRNVGTSKVIHVAGISVGGADAGNYTLAGTTTLASAGVAPAALTVTAVTAFKTYDGTVATTVIPVIFSGSLAAGDTAGFFEAFSSKNAAMNVALNAGGVVIDGNNGNNYSVNFIGATGSIFSRTLNVGANAQNRVYDGTMQATVSLSDNRIAGDDLVLGYASATFGDKNAGSGKAVAVTGISISGGADASNYTLAASAATASATISVRPLVITSTADTKTYDGGTTSTGLPAITTGSLAVGDSAVLSQSFASRNAGINIVLTAGGAINDGNGGNNYSLTFLPALGRINPRPLHVTALGQDRIYDGTTTASVTLSDDRIGGDAFTVNHGAAHFVDKNAGVAKAITVPGLNLSGPDAANYSPVNSTIAGTASIAPRTLNVRAKAQNKEDDGTNVASVTFTDDRIHGDVLTIGFDSALFADALVGQDKNVTVSGVHITGADSGNYVLASSTLLATATISPPILPPPPVPPNPDPPPPDPISPNPGPRPPFPVIPQIPSPFQPGPPLNPTPAFPVAPAPPTPDAPALPANPVEKPADKVSVPVQVASVKAIDALAIVSIQTGSKPIPDGGTPFKPELRPRPEPEPSSTQVKAEPVQPVKPPELPAGISRLGLSISLSITAGFVIHFTLPRALLASLLTSSPAWRWCDPVPVLRRRKAPSPMKKHSWASLWRRRVETGGTTT